MLYVFYITSVSIVFSPGEDMSWGNFFDKVRNISSFAQKNMIVIEV